MKYLEFDLKNVLQNNRIISGLGDGEKIVLLQQFDHLLFLCNNFVSAGKIKRGLEAFGKKVVREKVKMKKLKIFCHL